MATCKRMFVRSADKDIITNFSEDLIILILERLPIKDAVKTSVLRKQWRYRWTMMRTLSLRTRFSRNFLKVGAYTRNGFIRTVNQIMIHHKGPILKFHLHIPNVLLDSFQEVDQWMIILSRSNVRELAILNSNKVVYKVPSTVFSFIELRVLELVYCAFKPPHEFKGFPNLEVMSLTSVHFGSIIGGIMNTINLPQLKKLVLVSCINVVNFNIKASKLRTLSVIRCYNVMLSRLLHSEHLDVVQVKNFVHNLPQLDRCNLPMLLSKIPNVVSFTIDGFLIKVLGAVKFPKWLPHTVKCLKHLELDNFNFQDVEQLQGALSMIQNSPNLEVLHVKLIETGPEVDLELTSIYLESVDTKDQTPLMLRTVQITSLNGSRPELLIIKLILDHSPHLEKMIIRPRATADAKKMVNIAKDVMLFPRASTKAKMVFLVPGP